MTKALVVMSGGADSCISLFWAIRKTGWVPEADLIGKYIEAVGK